MHKVARPAEAGTATSKRVCKRPTVPKAIIALQRRERRHHSRVVPGKDLDGDRAVERTEQLAQKAGRCQRELPLIVVPDCPVVCRDIELSID